jgi:hypothetical protein
MNEFDLNKIPKINFVFDFKLPSGYIPFGYNKNTLSYNIFKKLEIEESDNKTLYHSSNENPNDFICKFGSPFTTYISEHTKNTKNIGIGEINYIKNDELYLIVIESQLSNNMFQYYGRYDFKIDNLLSPRLIDLLKNNKNFKLVFMDMREGSYPHDITFYEKINYFLINHDINEESKVIVSTNNNFIENIKEDNNFIKFNNKIDVYSNNYFLLASGRFLGELRTSNNLIIENGYDFSVQENIHYDSRDRYFIMYNRNTERLHRVYFVNKLYENNLINCGFISFFENPYLDSFLQNSQHYDELGLTNEDIKSIKNKYKNYTPMVIDNSNSDEISDYHNFLSRSNEYENSYFTIVSETNAESDYCFITEKTTKPIMNLHPFVVLGNPHTLKVLKKYGFKTFNKWWDESYDNEFDFKTRSDMVLDIVKNLCSKSKDEMNLMIREMSDTLYFNKKLLHKLNYNKIFQKEFFNMAFKNTDLLENLSNQKSMI